MPMLGFGTWLFPENEIKDVLKKAILDYGYRQIDTAKMYENERGIGEALQECFAQGIRREDVFITTKLWADDRSNVEDALRASLNRLQLDYVDLYVMHFMMPDIDKNTYEVKRTSTKETWI